MNKFIALTWLPISIALLIASCKNREVNEHEGPNFSEIHEDIEYHFDSVVINGIEYHILERDRNNPHEGFGFMALNGASILDNQDSIKAYLKTVLEVQAEIQANLKNEPIETTEEQINYIFKENLSISRRQRTSKKTKLE